MNIPQAELTVKSHGKTHIIQFPENSRLDERLEVFTTLLHGAGFQIEGQTLVLKDKKGK